MTISQALLKKVIIDQREEIDAKLKGGTLVERDIDIVKIKKYLSIPNIVIITGVRRSGKSTLATMILRGENFAHINFDDPRLARFDIGDTDTLMSVFYELYGTDIEYIILDELQNIKDWELFATSLRKSKKVIITGSNANLLSAELATHLTGRHIDVTLYPFSFKEYLRFNNVTVAENDIHSTKKLSVLNKHFTDYIRLGGFPEVYKIGREILKTTYRDILTKDILFRHNVKYKKELEEISMFMMSNFANEFSYRGLTKVFDIKSVYTMKDYISYLEESFLLQVLGRFSYKLKDGKTAPKKSYPIDTGLVNVIAMQNSENLGKKLELVIYLELLRQIAYYGEHTDIFYWQNHQGYEVDFVVKNGARVKELIQVTYDMADIKTKEREIKAILKASKDLRCNELYIITKDQEEDIEIDGKIIKVVPVVKWLLG